MGGGGDARGALGYDAVATEGAGVANAARTLVATDGTSVTRITLASPRCLTLAVPRTRLRKVLASGSHTHTHTQTQKTDRQTDGDGHEERGR